MHTNLYMFVEKSLNTQFSTLILGCFNHILSLHTHTHIYSFRSHFISYTFKNDSSDEHTAIAKANTKSNNFHSFVYWCSMRLNITSVN